MFLNAKINLLFIISHRFNINKSISRCQSPRMSNAMWCGVLVINSKHLAIPAIVITVAIDTVDGHGFNENKFHRSAKWRIKKSRKSHLLSLKITKNMANPLLTSKFLQYCIRSQYIYLKGLPILIEITIHHFC